MINATSQLPDLNCEHQSVELRYKEYSSGAWKDNPKRHFWEQCTTCGAHIRQVKAASISAEQRAQMRPVDDELREYWLNKKWDAWRDKRVEERQQEDTRWWNWYSAYLKSPEWLERRELVIGRTKGVCEGCETAPAVQVHHLTYLRVGNELLFDLVAVCKDCHQKAHPDKTINTDD